MTDDHSRTPHQQHAYRCGYRVAVGSRPMTEVPTYIERDDELLSQFQAGWKQGQADLNEQNSFFYGSPWKQRLTWFVIMLLGGFATSGILINNIQKETQPQTNVETKPEVQAHTLSLLSEQARNDLMALHQQLPTSSPARPLQPSSIGFEDIRLVDELDNALSASIPKFVRTLTFNATASTQNSFQVKWFWQDYLVQTTELTNHDTKITSHIKLSSAWTGAWRIEIWNEQHPIYRQTFNYGTSQ